MATEDIWSGFDHGTFTLTARLPVTDLLRETLASIGDDDSADEGPLCVAWSSYIDDETSTQDVTFSRFDGTPVSAEEYQRACGVLRMHNAWAETGRRPDRVRASEK